MVFIGDWTFAFDSEDLLFASVAVWRLYIAGNLVGRALWTDSYRRYEEASEPREFAVSVWVSSVVIGSQH